MTDEQWGIVDERLQAQFCTVTLKCDDYKVELRLVQISQFKLAITVYVNGWLKGEWFKTDNLSDEARRFFPTRYINYYSGEQKKIWKKMGKRLRKEHNININERYEYKGFHWTSFTALKRHFIANNKSIELIDEAPNG